MILCLIYQPNIPGSFEVAILHLPIQNAVGSNETYSEWMGIFRSFIPLSKLDWFKELENPNFIKDFNSISRNQTKYWEDNLKVYIKH